MANYSDIRYVATGVTEYATVDNLPTSGNTTGDQALVTGTNRLYIWNGSGWYNIALINTNPSISGASSAYTLETDGTATTVTITATDPEGLPITYSIASDTSGNVATVTQGTGANTNVFTITPTTNTANGGTFSLTFRASDGVNIATAVSSFTLEFTIENSNYTTALITSVGANNAVNNSFDDASTNNHTVTANGNVTQNTFSPYRHGGYSTYFDGSGDYINFGNDASLSFGTGEFTIECWIYRTAANANYEAILSGNVSGTGMGLYSHASNNTISIYSSASNLYTTSTTISNNTWHHICATRNSSNVLKIYIDGTEGYSGTVTDTFNMGTSGFQVGADPAGGNSALIGYIRDVRLIKGSVVTPPSGGPTVPLTAVTNTSILTCHLPYIVDGSSNAHTGTVYGNTKTEPFAPYDYSNPYSASDNGGSIYFDGTSGYVSGDMTADLAFGTDDMTLECWVYPNTISGFDAIFDTRTSSFTGNAFTIQLDAGVPKVFAGNYSNSAPVIAGTSAVSVSIWTHIALSRSSGTNTLFINGTSVATNTNSWNQSFSSANDWAVGETPPTATPRYFDGYISDFRIVKGTAVYTSAFTPPTAPLTAITNTKLLLNGTDAGIIDKSQSVKTITLNGNVSSSTTQTKYLSSSMYFDGTGDCISSVSSAELGTGDFTLEAWIYPTQLDGNDCFIGDHWSGTTAGFIFRAHTNNYLSIFDGTQNQASTTAVVTNQWQHVAAARQNGTLKLFLDGTEVLSVSTSSSLSGPGSGESLTIGGHHNSAGGFTNLFNGYISDARVTKGLARYTANFTAPTAELKG